MCSITTVVDDTIPSYRIMYFHERYNRASLRKTVLKKEENEQCMKKIKLFMCMLS